MSVSGIGGWSGPNCCPREEKATLGLVLPFCVVIMFRVAAKWGLKETEDG
jgi:hypothetical protein